MVREENFEKCLSSGAAVLAHQGSREVPAVSVGVSLYRPPRGRRKRREEEDKPESRWDRDSDGEE